MIVPDARLARAEALLRVEQNTDPDWKTDAKRALWQAIQHLDELTTDDIVCRAPREPRAWGPVLRACAKRGFIENTGRTRESSRAACHARPKTVWRVNRAAVARAST